MADRKLNDEKEFLRQCINLYKELPSLWNVKSKAYYDRTQKEKSYNILLKKYRQRFPNASRKDLKKKLNCLRTNYRKELRKYLHSVEIDAKPLYKPSLWYYTEMSFLQDMQATEPSGDSEALMDIEPNYLILEADDDDSNVYEERSLSISPVQQSPIRSEVIIKPESKYREPVPAKVAKRHIDREETSMQASYENISENKDEHFHWAMACASDLRKMERTQQLYAKKAIAEILMEGQLGMLHRHSVKVNEPEIFGHSSKSSGQFGATSTFIEYETEQQPSDLDKKPYTKNPLEDEQ